MAAQLPRPVLQALPLSSGVGRQKGSAAELLNFLTWQRCQAVLRTPALAWAAVLLLLPAQRQGPRQKAALREAQHLVWPSAVSQMRSENQSAGGHKELAAGAASGQLTVLPGRPSPGAGSGQL